MKRNEFEQAVFLRPGGEYRRAVILQTLALANSFKIWSDGGSSPAYPYYPNDIVFVCVYSQYKQNPTPQRANVMRFFLGPRNGNEAGFMVDPAHKDSGARKAAFSKLVDMIKQNTAIPGDLYKQVYSEMWLEGGSMKAWLAIGHTFEGMLQNVDFNSNVIRNDEAKLSYYKTFQNKFCGVSLQGDTQYHNLFDSATVGLDLRETRMRSVQRAPGLVPFNN